MAYEKSIVDIITEALYPVIRDLHDVGSKNILGSKVLCLKINRPASGNVETLWDDGEDDFLVSEIIGNAIIEYPTEDIELFQERNNTTMDTEVQAISLEDFIPVRMTLTWDGDVEDDPNELQKGDLICDVHFGDAETKKFAIILEVVQIKGETLGKYIVRKFANLTLYRGELFDDVQDAVDDYLGV